MKKFKVSEALKPELTKVLENKKISFVFVSDTELKAACSGSEFHRAVVRARCELRNKEEDLEEDTSYYLPQVESPERVRDYNPDYIRLIPM